MPEIPPAVSGAEGSDDPITTKSYSFALLLSSFLLILSLAWALYDEMFALRPWRAYQARFAKAYARFLDEEIPRKKAVADAIRQSPGYAKFEEQIKAAKDAARARLEQIDNESLLVDSQLAAMTNIFQDARAQVTALVYRWEIASQGSKPGRQKALEQARKQKREVRLPAAEGRFEEKSLDYDELEQLFNDLKARRARLTADRVEAERAAADLIKARDAYFAEKMVGLNEQQLALLKNAVGRMDILIRQINVEKAGLVDRCQSCHVAMDPKLVPINLTLTKADLKLANNRNAPFSSHPAIELLKLHDPERLGCSPCHGGNGRATSSVVKGHGRHKYWLWPLYYPENYQSGCQQCHAADMVLDYAPVLNRGKELYRLKGCIGCHRFEGFDNESEQLVATRQLIRQLGQQRKDFELDIPRLQERADDPNTDDATSSRLRVRATNLVVEISNIDARVEQLELKAHSLQREEKKVGPSLKEVRVKLRKEWIPYWLEKTHEFRPGTKMPQFRLQADEIRALAAFIWQSGVEGKLPAHPAGNAARGKELFETRGCMACHAIAEGQNALGGTFAANLSRVGEKANYDYLVRWIHDPRERTRPYCPYEKRDLGPEDYAKKGLPFVFDLEHSRCPNDGHELQVQQPTVMPSLRLTWEEARDIASFVITQKRPDANYAPAAYLDDPKLKAEGRALVKNYGCAGCHEIATLEDEGRVGTELTTEGSKPIERLDFALLTHDAKAGHLPDGSDSPRGSWYDQKGFIEAKLADSAVFDRGKLKLSRLEQLKMPKPNVTPAEITALTTFLLGSVDPTLPRDLVYRPADPRRDAQDGWWLVTKYNCMGCHQVQVGQKTVLQDLPRYLADNKDKLPPPLIGEGARVDPNWLARFLENPAMSKTDLNRNGVRSYLQARMPTFSFSENEVRKIVRFFEALASQQQPYLPPKLEPLTDTERALARQLFTSPAAPCLKCHATGSPTHDANATAPNFLLARERLRPAWTTRWITDPAKIAPGTAMPSGLFRRVGERWIFAGTLPPATQAYPRDHAELLTRYMLQLTPEEQRLLLGRSSSAASGSGGRK